MKFIELTSKDPMLYGQKIFINIDKIEVFVRTKCGDTMVEAGGKHFHVEENPPLIMGEIERLQSA